MFPKDPDTLFRLLTFSSVPGLARHRTLFIDQENTCYDGGKHKLQYLRDKNIAPSSYCRIANLLGRIDHPVENESDPSRIKLMRDETSGAISLIIYVRSIAIEVANNTLHSKLPALPLRLIEILRDQTYTELHLLKNNCYSFALDLLGLLDSLIEC